MRNSRLLAAAALASLAFGLAPSTADARVRAYFTSRGDDAPGAIIRAFQAAERRAREGRPASIDIAVFSFTHFGIADELLRIAAEQPTLRVRLIVDLSQLSHSEQHVAPYIEDIQRGKLTDACTLRYDNRPTAEQAASCKAELRARFADNRLPNVEVKYKWYDGYGWDARLGRPKLEHGKSLLMHRKLAIVNGDTILAGSFNWSPQAARSNYENLIVISGTAERETVDAYRAEFEAMWNNAESYKPGPECRALRQVIWDRLRAEHQSN